MTDFVKKQHYPGGDILEAAQAGLKIIELKKKLRKETNRFAQLLLRHRIEALETHMINCQRGSVEQ